MPGSVTFYDEDGTAPLGVQEIPDLQAAVMADIPAGAARVVVAAQAPPDTSRQAWVTGLEDQLAGVMRALPEDPADQPYDRWSPEAAVLVRVYEALYGTRPWWARDDVPR